VKSIKFCKKNENIYDFLFILSIGISYVGQNKNQTAQKILRTVNFFEESREYELLHLLEFDSTRKRMSAILRSLKKNEILLYSKGAEDSIFSCCTSGNIQQCNNNISEFAKLGWRTLAFSFRILSQSELSQYDKMLLDAYNDVTSREEKMNQAFKKIESGLTLLGATGIEDRLQEDCDKTLEALRKGGIKVWVLTGDKKETALNIAKSCKHFSNDMILFNLTDLQSNDIEKRISESKAR
jgi:phospholipid-translocating ATPase